MSKRPETKSPRAIRKHKRGLCMTPRCRNKHRVRSWCCNSCDTRAKRFRNPIKYVFATLKGNARRRGKDFSLTIEQFISFIKDNNYMNGRGRSKFSLSIDRENNEFGYHAWNIRAITLEENTFKRNFIDYTPKAKLEYVKPEGEAF